MASLHVWFESITTFLRIFIVPLSSLSLLMIHLIRFTLLVLFLHWPISDLTFPFHRSCISHYQFDLPHCLVIHIIFTLGILKSTAHGIYYTCCISHMRAWVSDRWVFEPSFPSFLSPITLAYVTSRVLRPPWGHGIRWRLRQPLLGQVLEIRWYLDIVMLLLLGVTSLMCRSDSVVFKITGIMCLTMDDLVSPDFWPIVPLVPH